MAYNANDRVSPDDMGTVIEASRRERLVNMLPWVGTVMRTFQSAIDAGGVRQVDIYTLQSELTPDAPAAIARTRNQVWGTPTEDGIAYDKLVLDKYADAARKIAEADYRELPTRRTLEAHAISMNRTLAKKINDDIATEKFSSRAVKAANIHKQATTVTITNAGAVAGNADKVVYDACDMYWLMAADDGFGVGSETPFMLFAEMDPPTWVALKNYLLGKNYYAAFNEALLKRGSMENGMGGTLMAVINNVHIMVNNYMPTFNDGTHDYRQVLFTTNRDTELITAPPIVSMSDPSSPVTLDASGNATHAPQYTHFVRETYGVKAIDDRYGMVLQIKNTA